MRFRYGFKAIAMLLAIGIQTTQAQDVEFVSTEALREVQDVETCCNHRHYYGMAELALLQPSFGTATAIGAANPGTFGVQASGRYTFGVENSEGTGLRLRYWHLDGTAPIGIAEFETLDVDLTMRTSLGNFDLAVSGGVRYGRTASGAGAGAPNLRSYEGAGPTLSAEVFRPFGNRGFSFFANSRVSYLFGDGEDIAIIAPVDLHEGALQSFEHQIGLQWDRMLTNGNGLFARFAYEAQYWEGTGIFGQNSAGLVGPTFAIGFTR